MKSNGAMDGFLCTGSKIIIITIERENKLKTFLNKILNSTRLSICKPLFKSPHIHPIDIQLMLTSAKDTSYVKKDKKLQNSLYL